MGAPAAAADAAKFFLDPCGSGRVARLHATVEKAFGTPRVRRTHAIRRNRSRWSREFFSRPFADSISPFSCALVPGKLR